LTVRRTRFDNAMCPIARTTDLVGDWWTPLVMRQAFAGTRRFADFADQLDIPRAVLTARLKRLVEEGLLERVQYQDTPVRYEYRLTQQGREFWSVLAAMWRWGSDWLWDGDQPPVALFDRVTGDVIRPVVVDEATGRPVDVSATRIGRNPNA
jgi:DNA-binding HxlR family transcriptional regulator